MLTIWNYITKLWDLFKIYSIWIMQLYINLFQIYSEFDGEFIELN